MHILFVKMFLFNSGISQVGRKIDVNMNFYLFLLRLLASSFQAVVNRQIFAGNLANAQTLRKEKYPREFCPEVKYHK